ncbi:hypothetical protein N7510_009610 [Penicillium lagena]|uniref:uncharacterized protein n=1 Tax=Penicillium lagena TaxID=94218 RepID=UPI00253F8A39|nr:uncharacterized protein N7510_009610 [Penicillium lagena]KAJ5604456.1 hypothetical protein N7510_009610 [Penicillium lagena]
MFVPIGELFSQFNRVGYLVSATVICIDSFCLSSHRPQKHEKMPMASLMIKFSFIIIELALILAFRYTEQISSVPQNTAAILEWVIAFAFAGYILSFVIDLIPSGPRLHPFLSSYKQLEMSMDLPRLSV